MKAVRTYAIKEEGENMGKRVQEVLKSVSEGVRKVIALWEKGG